MVVSFSQVPFIHDVSTREKEREKKYLKEKFKNLEQTKVNRASMTQFPCEKASRIASSLMSYPLNAESKGRGKGETTKPNKL